MPINRACTVLHRGRQSICEKVGLFGAIRMFVFCFMFLEIYENAAT